MVLISLVSIEYLPIICDLIAIPQGISPANVVFSGIGVLLLVSIILDVSRSELAIITLAFIRQLKMQMQVHMCSLKSCITSMVCSTILSRTQKCHRLLQ